VADTDKIRNKKKVKISFNEYLKLGASQYTSMCKYAGLFYPFDDPE
jgi:hypothetical protein